MELDLFVFKILIAALTIVIHGKTFVLTEALARDVVMTRVATQLVGIIAAQWVVITTPVVALEQIAVATQNVLQIFVRVIFV